jgi:hypothetical protein
VKGHDFQFWSAPLRFQPDGSILPIEKVPSWQTRVLLGSERAALSAPYLWPKKRDPNPVRTDACTGKPLPPEQFDGFE